MNQTVNEKNIRELAEEIYESTLRFTLETPENIGRLVSIDVDSGDYELGSDEDVRASFRLCARCPRARTFMLRIGYKTAFAVGGTLERIPR